MTRIATLVACVLLACSASFAEKKAADGVKSGLQPGEKPPAYQVLDATGPNEGNKLCYRCQYGGSPVVNIFTRELNESVAKLIQNIDGKVGENKDKKMKAFVVLLTDEPDADTAKLKAFAKKYEIKNTPLTTFENTAGPGNYKIAKDASLTVMMWSKMRVRANHAFAKADLSDKSVEAVSAETSKILK